MYSKEDIKMAEKLDIVDYCMQNDIALQQDSERYYRLVEHDSLIIDRLKNKFYWNSRGANGNIINFVQQVEGTSFPGAMQRLLEGKDNYTKTSEVEFVAEPYEYSPEKEVSRFDKARDYLINERKIDKQIVDELHNQSLIKQDKHNNVLFIWKDHEHNLIMGCTEQGVIQSEKYKRGTWKSIQKNSTVNYGFNVLYGEPKNLKFFESSIDMLSYATLNKNNLADTHLISMEGLKPQTLLNYFVNSNKKLGDLPDSLSLCVDNDTAGKAFVDRLQKLQFARKDGSILKFQSEFPKPSSAEQNKWDWNDECKHRAAQHEQIRRQRHAYLQQGREI